MTGFFGLQQQVPGFQVRFVVARVSPKGTTSHGTFVSGDFRLAPSAISLSIPTMRARIAPNVVELKRIISTFTYRIEAKPEGGFVAHASDPILPALEAPTRQELQRKIQANINAALAAEFSGLNLPSGKKELKFDFHIEAKPGGGFTLHSSDASAAPIEGATHEEIAHPFAEKLAGVVGKYFLPKELSDALAQQAQGGEVQVSVDRKFSFTTNTGFDKTAFNNTQGLQPSGTIQPDGADSRGFLNAGDGSPITGEASKSWPIIRFFLTLLVVAALMYFWLHR
jgi:hypothetical protein